MSLPHRQMPAPTPLMATNATPNFATTATISGDVTSPGVTTTASSHDGLLFHQYMLAGSLAGVVEHTAMFPIDTLKTRMQVATSPSLRIPSISLAGLYRGIAAMALGAGPAHAVYFSVYEISKNVLTSPENHNNHHVAHATSGVIATVASDAVLTPMDTVKQRLQLTGSPYKGVVDCVTRVVREEGMGALYKSYWATVLMNAPFTAVHFASYEAAKRGLVVEDEEEGLGVHATAGALAGALAAVVTTPLDVVKTQLQCQGVCGCDRFPSSTIGEVIQTIVKRDGYSGLMRGWKPRMLFHAPAAAICWSTYEAAKSFLQRRNEVKKNGT